MPLFSVDDKGEPDAQFSIDLGMWRNTLKEVPNDYLERAYDAASEDWNFANEYKQFPPDLIRDAYREIVQEEKRTRADDRASYRQTITCKHVWNFEPEDKDSISGNFYLGFNVCQKCGRTQPVPNPELRANLKKYYQAAVAPRDRAGNVVPFVKDEDIPF